MADKKYFRITAGVEYERDFYVQAQDKENALEELEGLDFLKEETGLFSSRIEVNAVNKDRDIVEVSEKEAQPQDVIQTIKDVMANQGFVVVSCGQGINGVQGYNFLHRRTGEYVWVQQEDLDEEQIWDVLGVTEQEIRSRIEERNKTEDSYTGEQMDSKVGDWQDEDYRAVILEIIDEKARELSRQKQVDWEGAKNA